MVIICSVKAGFFEGLFEVVDEEVGVFDTGGELQGKVEKIFTFPGDNPEHLCDKCKGDRYNKPVIGMRILWGLRDEGGVWKGGHILDPNNGKTYRCKLTPSEDGRELGPDRSTRWTRP